MRYLIIVALLVVGCYKPCDFNKDKHVNRADLDLLKEAFGGPDMDFDVDKNGEVGIGDWSICTEDFQ
jgi:hypothetical protein